MSHSAYCFLNCSSLFSLLQKQELKCSHFEVIAEEILSPKTIKSKQKHISKTYQNNHESNSCSRSRPNWLHRRSHSLLLLHSISEIREDNGEGKVRPSHDGTYTNLGEDHVPQFDSKSRNVTIFIKQRHYEYLSGSYRLDGNGSKLVRRRPSSTQGGRPVDTRA